MFEYRVITPADVLFLRGNRLFGGAGEHGAAEMPPWPSVFAGAVASRILADHDRIAAVAASPSDAERILAEVAGPDYACAFLALGRRGRVFLPLPADLVAEMPEGAAAPELRRLRPRRVPDGLTSSAPLPMVPALESAERRKPLAGYWLDLDGWQQHLQGELPDPDHLVASRELWQLDPRLGIARDPNTRTAAEGRIYTSEAVALAKDTCFVAGFSGRNIPANGLVRLGGDGRGAHIEPAGGHAPEPAPGRPEGGWPGFRMILTSPGVFPGGWLPPGCQEDADGIVFTCGALRARLRAAAAGRHGVISGWDLARHRPKPARKVVPTGTVYWFSVEDGDTAELEHIWRNGLYAACPNLDKEFAEARRREGFGRAWFGIWQPE